MPDYNYSNPSGMAPKMGWSPQGFLAGNMYYDQEQDYRKSMGQSHTQGDMAIRQREAEYQDYLANAPVRESKRGLDIATNTAQAPIQGKLAGAMGATADATTLTAPSDARAKVFQNEAKRKAYAEELVSNYLNANLQQNAQNPTQAMMVWRDQIVPQLERQVGEALPQEFKNMSFQQMQMISRALTQNTETRRSMLMQGQKDAAHMARTQAEVAGRSSVAAQRGDATTAGEHRRQVAAELEEAYRTNNRPRIRALEAVYGGNPASRGAAAVDTDAGKRDNARLEFEKRTAILLPENPKDRQIGDLYKGKSGNYARWDGVGLLPVE